VTKEIGHLAVGQHERDGVGDIVVRTRSMIDAVPSSPGRPPLQAHELLLQARDVEQFDAGSVHVS